MSDQVLDAAKEGKLEVVQSLCKENPALAKEKDSAGNTPSALGCLLRPLSRRPVLVRAGPYLGGGG